jgi:hypothetical protein
VAGEYREGRGVCDAYGEIIRPGLARR